MFLIKKLFKLVFKFKLMNVFDITIEHSALIAEIEENGGEITPEIAERLAINESNLNTKVRAYYHIIKTTESQITLAKEEQERLMTVRKVKENLIKRLKNAVDIAVEEFGIVKKDAKAKSLDLGDLKVWQKKTEALDVTGEIDDERFCKKQFSFTIEYNRVVFILDALEHLDINPNITIDLTKDKLKQWLLDNEEEHKKLIDEHNERLKDPNILFEEKDLAHYRDNIPEIEEDISKENDIKILLNTTINHNSTVVFK